MNNNLATMKIDNNSVESSTKPLNKSKLNNNNILIDKNGEKPLYKQPTHSVTHIVDRRHNHYDDYFESYNERTECEVCDRLVLTTWLHDGLCEMCSVKSNKKIRIFKKKTNNT
jgi:predicted RNA-binding protein associated with RNAse of E/G family